MSEEPSATPLRWAAATMALAAGAIHLAQVGVHTDEDPLFGIFFVVVGALQLAGGSYLVRPVGPPTLVSFVVVLGIVGSLATIGIWGLSRTLGLPFGAEPGRPEEIGLADAAADLLELFTAMSLLWWLRHPVSPRARTAWSGAVSITALALAALWIGARIIGVFDPDPRLVLEPGWTDSVAVGLLVVLSAFFAFVGLYRAASQRAASGGRLASTVLLGSLVLLEVPLVAFTIPARGGQNIECRYAPIAEDSGLSHARLPEPIAMHVGDRRSVVVLLLLACGDGPLELRAAVPLQPKVEGVVVRSVSVDRTRTYRVDRVRDAPGPASVPLTGLVMRPGTGRYPVTIEVEAVAEGLVTVGAFRVEYVFRGEPASFGFASFTRFCIGDAACRREP